MSNSPGSNSNIHIPIIAEHNINDNSLNHTFFDISGNTIIDHITSNITTQQIFINDISDNTILSDNIPIITDISNTIITGSGYQINIDEGFAQNGSSIIRTTFTSTEPNLYDPVINEILTQQVEIYNDEIDSNSPSEIILNQIRNYASEINCEDFHGKGTIDDYTNLFIAASKIANESKQMELDIDIEGFSEFAKAADDLSSLFTSFITKLQNVNIITDIHFLTTISNALEKIVNLSKVFGKFKETILTTTTIQMPKSAHDTNVILQGVMDELNCAMSYIQHFVNPGDDSLNDSELSSDEKNIIKQSINTIENWNILCEQGVTIAMSNNIDVQNIKQASNELKNTTQNLKNATSTLKQKLTSLNIYM